MVEVRKEFCDICGYAKIIVVREQVRRKLPLVGLKEILVCKECQSIRGTPQFNEYYQIALRGTIYEGQTFVKARKKAKSPIDTFSPVPKSLTASAEKAMAPLFDVDSIERIAAETEAQRIQRQSHLFSMLNPDMQAYVRSVSYRSFLIGAALAGALIAAVLGALVSLGVLHA